MSELGVIEMPPMRRRASPCLKCNGQKFVRVIPREYTVSGTFTTPGVLVTEVGQGAALNIGLRRGDIVRTVNGQPVVSVRDLAAAITNPSAAWEVTIERNGQRVTARFRA